MAILLTSPAFKEGGQIPVKYSCHGQDISPPLTWSNAPAAAAGYTLIVEDPDASAGTFTHWVIFNIPPQLTGLPEGLPREGRLTSGAVQGKNSMGKTGYAGPCPPPGKPHHYHFRFYVQDRLLPLQPGASKEQVRAALQGHTLGQAELMGLFAVQG